MAAFKVAENLEYAPGSVTVIDSESVFEWAMQITDDESAARAAANWVQSAQIGEQFVHEDFIVTVVNDEA